MSELEICKSIADARKYIGCFRIYKALEILTSIAGSLYAHDVSDRLRELKETYKYMSRYLEDGVDDPSREKVYADILSSLYKEADMLECLTLSKEHPGVFFNTLRNRIAGGENMKLNSLLAQYYAASEKSELLQESGADVMKLIQERDEVLQRIFDYIWVSVNLTREDKDTLFSLLTASDKYSSLRNIIVSALFLSLLQYYDSTKLLLIAKAYPYADSPELKARLVVTLLFCLAIYPERTETSIELSHVIDSLKEEEGFKDSVRIAFINILRSRDTERINKKMKNELMPGIKKIQDSIGNKIGFRLQESELSGEEFNPEWEELLQESGMLDKMRELQDLQTEGADVLMLPFSNLKNFSFFRSIANWFLPYDPNHSQLNGYSEILKKIVLPLASIGSGICDSDLYSMSFSFMSMPDEHKKGMQMQLENQFAALKEQMESDSGMDVTPGTSFICYIRNLYRFFKLYPRRHEFKDPFSEVYNLAGLPFIGDVLAEKDTLRLAAEFYFKTGAYASALNYFKELIALHSDDLQILQKAGFAAQSVGNYSEALQYYLAATDYAPESLWLMKKIAVCYRNMGDSNNAADYFRRALSIDPDNISLNMQYAAVLLLQKKIEEALKIYYKVDYMDNESGRALRPIAWCEFLINNYSKSRAYYEKIMFGQPTHTDYLNMGHLCLCENRLKEAIHYYKESYKESGLSSDNWLKEFDGDRDILMKEKEVRETDLNIILDSICN